MKICIKCNGENEDENIICTHCGAAFESQFSQNPGATYNPVIIRNNSFAIASMVLGIVSVPLICCCYIGVIPAILAVVFGFVARNRIITSAGAEKGNGMALAGIILGFSTIGLVILFLILAFTGVFSSNEFMNQFRDQLENSGVGGNL